MKNEKNIIRLEIRRLIGDLIGEEHSLVLKVVNRQISHGADINAKESIYENSGVSGEILKEEKEFNGNVEYVTEVMGYTVSFIGTMEGSKRTLKETNMPPEYDIDVFLETIKIDGEKNVSIDFDILSNKNVISEGTLSKLENNISEILKCKLD